MRLPPATPELQPAERLWPLLNEGLANGAFARIGRLERALARRCRQLVEQPELIRPSPAIIGGRIANRYYLKGFGIIVEL